MGNEDALFGRDMLSGTAISPKMYSKRAIWWFSFGFSAVFGSLLLMQNLRSIGRKKAAYKILLLSILYTAMASYVVNIPGHPVILLSCFFNLAGSDILAEFFYKKHFPVEGEYEKKKIWKPLIIAVLACLLLLA